MTRSTPRLSTSERLALFLAARGRCAACDQRIWPGQRWEVDHVVPRGLGGAHARANLQVLCAPCHVTKTASQDVPRIAKAQRLKARHLGAWRPTRVLPGSKASGWKKSLDGRVSKRPR